MSVSRADILNLLQHSIDGSGLIGGKRRRVVRRRRAPRRLPHMMGHGHMYGYGEPEVAAPGIEAMVREVVEEQLMTGDGLIGGRRRRRRKVGRGPRMPEHTKRYLAAYHRAHPRRKRGGANAENSKRAQEYYDTLVDEYAYKGVKDPYALAYDELKKPGVGELLQYGIVPKTPKQRLISQIMATQKHVGLKVDSKAELEKYNVAALKRMMASLAIAANALEYPPKFSNTAYAIGEPDEYVNARDIPALDKYDIADTGYVR